MMTAPAASASAYPDRPAIECPILTREQRVALALADVAGLIRDVKLIEGGDPNDPAAPGVELRLRRCSRRGMDAVNAALVHASLRFAGCTAEDFGYRWLPADTEPRVLPVRVTPRDSEAGAILAAMPKNGELTAYAIRRLFFHGAPPTFWAPDDAAASRYAQRIDLWAADSYPFELVKL